MENELYHYGVLGMKWGVRRNPAEAYERASKKMAKLKNRAEKAAVRYGKKAGFHFTDFGVAAENRARKRSARATGRATRWQRAMDKTFSTKKLSALEKKYISRGESYMNKIKEASDPKKQISYSDKAAKMYAKGNELKSLREKLHNA